MTDLAARIAAHPVAAAVHRLGMAEDGARHAAAGTTEEYVRALAVHDAAEGALIAALDTDDAKAGDLQHHLMPLIGWLRMQHLASEEDRLAAIAKIVDGIRVLEPEFDVDRTVMPAAIDVRATDDPEVRRRLPTMTPMACTEMQHSLGLCACGDVDPEDPDDVSLHERQDTHDAPEESTR